MVSLHSTTVNPAGVMPRGGGYNPNSNPFMEGMRQEDERQAREAQMQMQQAQAQKDNQLAAYKAMQQDPRNAAQIAQMYGVPFDENMQRVFADRELSASMIEGAELTDVMGIENPQAVQTFIQSYIKSGRNPIAAQQAIAGMQLGKPEKPDYSYAKSVGDSLIDARTGKVLYQGPTGQPGMDKSGKAIPVWQDPRLPWNLRERARGTYDTDWFDPDAASALERDIAPYLGGAVSDTSGTAPMNLPLAPAPGQSGLDSTKVQRFRDIMGIGD